MKLQLFTIWKSCWNLIGYYFKCEFEQVLVLEKIETVFAGLEMNLLNKPLTQGELNKILSKLFLVQALGALKKVLPFTRPILEHSGVKRG